MIDLASDLFIWGHPLVVMHRTRALHGSRGGPGILRRPDITARRTAFTLPGTKVGENRWTEVVA